MRPVLQVYDPDTAEWNEATTTAGAMQAVVDFGSVARVFHDGEEIGSIWMDGALIWARPPAPGETFGIRIPSGDVIVVQIAATWAPVLTHNSDGSVTVNEA